MIGLKKDTPAARAALAKRRQRGTTPKHGDVSTPDPFRNEHESNGIPPTLLSVVAGKNQEPTSKIPNILQKSKAFTGFSSNDVLLSGANVRMEQSETSSEEEEEEETVVEIPEPTDYNDVRDASCLPLDSFITIKPCLSMSTLAVSNEQHAMLSGIGLGSPNERIQITIANLNAVGGMLRYGDAVAFYSSRMHGFLGTHQLYPDERGGGTTWEVAFRNSVIRQGERWTVLHPNRRLWIGPAALEYMKKEKQSKTTRMVRSGEPVVLRNHLNGGLLSVKSINEVITLVILTDSYEESINGESASDRLQHHNQLVPSDKECFRLLLTTVPPCPQWISEKCVFQVIETSTPQGNVDQTTILKICATEQERILVDELIASLMGLEGELIQIGDGQKNCFVLNENMPLTPSLRNLVDFVLPVSTSYTSIRRFLNEHYPGYEFGQVVQALCQVVDDLLQDYLLDIVDISNQFRNSHLIGETPMTLNHLFIKVQGHRHTLSILERVILDATAKKGGCLLNAIRDLRMRMFIGDSHAQRILHLLLERSSIPYMELLQAWLETGILDDPCGEFMIERSDHLIDNGGYDGDSWDGLFLIVTENVLDGVLSSKDLFEMVLATGKYLNAIHLCETGAFVSHSAPGVEKKTTEKLRYNTDPVLLASCVGRLYQAASTHLLRLILCDYDLPQSLRTMKRYFLLDQGDFLLNFLDDAEPELSNDISKVSRGRIQHWLSTALQVTETTTDDSASASIMFDPLRTLQPLSAFNIRCDFAAESLISELDALHSSNGGIQKLDPKTPSKFPYGTVKGLTGMMAFTLDFPVVQFPTSLFISRQNLLNYKLLFRHLFFAKTVERRLVGIWSNHQTMKLLQDLHGALRQTFCLRQRMLHLMQNFIYYMMSEVLEPNWFELISKVEEPHKCLIDHCHKSESVTVDRLMQLHSAFLDQSLEQCLLTNQNVVQSLSKLMSTCLLFSEQMDRFMHATKINEENEIAANKKRTVIQRNLNSAKTSLSKAQLRKIVTHDQEERRLRIAKQTARVERELHNESYKRMIKRYSEVFDANLAEFMLSLQSQPNDRFQAHIANLCIRLDFNGFVTRQMDSI